MNRLRKIETAGFTLTEMLIVLSILGILMGMIIPAVQSARATARKMHCQTNQKQLALATLTYENINERFPAYQHELSGNKVGFVVMLFPHMEQMKLWEMWEDSTIPVADKSIYLRILVCPGDALDRASGSPNSYVCNRGNPTVPPPDPVPFDAPILIAQFAGDSKSIDWINEQDGTANTLLFSEKEFGDPPLLLKDRYRYWINLDQDGNAVGFKYDSPMDDNISSHHGNGVNVVFCDGHAQFVSNGIGKTGTDAEGNNGKSVYDSLCHPDDGYLDPAKYED